MPEPTEAPESQPEAMPEAEPAVQEPRGNGNPEPEAAELEAPREQYAQAAAQSARRPRKPVERRTDQREAAELLVGALSEYTGAFESLIQEGGDRGHCLESLELDALQRALRVLREHAKA